MMEINKVRNFTEWDQWKKTLSKAVNFGEAIGMSEETVGKIGFRIGNVLSAAVDPENREQRLLQELWRAGDDEERKMLTKMLIKMVQTDDQ